MGQPLPHVWVRKWTHRELVRYGVALLLLEGIEGDAEGGHQIREALSLSDGAGELIVKIDAVKAVVLDELDGAADKGRAARGIGNEVEVTAL